MAAKKDIIRFWSKVQKHKNCCWIWIACKDKANYGQFQLRGRLWKAHRVAYFLTYKDPGKLCVLHKCDNPSCVRPDHLFLGTCYDNNRDCIQKGRYRNGHVSHFSPNQIRTIRKLRRQGYLLRYIAAKYNLSQTMVSQIASGARCSSII